MELSEQFLQSKENSIIKLPNIDCGENNEQTINQRCNQFENLMLPSNELNLNNDDKFTQANQSIDSSINIISNLLKEKPIYNKIYSKINNSRNKKRQNLKLTANEIINSYQNDESLFKRRNSPIREVKMNLLVTEVDKNYSLKNSMLYNDQKNNSLKMDYDLLNNQVKRKLIKEKTTKISPKVANLLVHSPGEWKKARNCSLKYRYNINKKSINEVTGLLHIINRKVEATFDVFKKKAEKDFDDIYNL